MSDTIRRCTVSDLPPFRFSVVRVGTIRGFGRSILCQWSCPCDLTPRNCAANSSDLSASGHGGSDHSFDHCKIQDSTCLTCRLQFLLESCSGPGALSHMHYLGNTDSHPPTVRHPGIPTLTDP